MTHSGSMIQPGQILKPQVSEKTAMDLVQRLYGLKVEKIKELNGYDDINYHVMVSDEHSNPNIPQINPDGYVLKVMNTVDSAKNHIEAEHAMMKILCKNGIGAPLPALSLDGKEFPREKIYAEDKENFAENNDIQEERPHGVHIVRLLNFIPGFIFHQTPYNGASFYMLGKYLGKIHSAVEGFTHPALDGHQAMWNLASVPKLSEFVYAVRDEQNKRLLQDIIKAFSEEVEPLYDQLTRGIIHGDYNEQNIIMEPAPNQEDVPVQDRLYDIRGVIDFGDCAYSFLVFDIAIIIMYMMVETPIDPLETGGHVLAGYLSERSLNQADYEALKVCIAGRFAQSLGMGEYTLMLDPGNEYVVITAPKGWKRLYAMWNTPKEEMLRIWHRVIDSYQNGS